MMWRTLTVLWLGMAFSVQQANAAEDTPASADVQAEEKPLLWDWSDGVVRRYLLRSQLDLPEAIPMFASVNTDTLVTSVTTTLVVDCFATERISKKLWSLRCDIKDAAFSAVAIRASNGFVEDVAREWSEVASQEGAHLQITQRTDGKLVLIDLEGVPKSRRRLQLIHGIMRLLMVRSLAPLDVHMPKNGDDRGAGAWVQKSSHALAYPSLQGSAGGIKLTQTVRQREGGVLTIETVGRGSVSSGDEISEAVNRNTFIVDMNGSAVFDANVGAITEAQYVAEGRPTASSVVAEARNTNYIQVALAKQLPLDTLPELLEVGEAENDRPNR
ncbi:MAG: hypothetical protein ACON5B_11360 [Myxococcota bacterium]